MKTLKMQFTMSDNKSVLTMSLPSVRADVTAEQVKAFMNTVIAKDAISYNGMTVTAAKAATIVTTDDEVIF